MRNYVKERFVEQLDQIFRTIHRINLKTFKSIRALPKEQEASGKSQTQRENKLRLPVPEGDS